MCQNFLLMKYDINAFYFHFIEESNNLIRKIVKTMRKGENNLVELYFSLLSNKDEKAER